MCAPRRYDLNHHMPLPMGVYAISCVIVNSAFRVHSTLGPGLLERVYETCLVHELTKRSLPVQRQLVLPVIYDGVHMDSGLRLDLLVNHCVVVEITAVEHVLPVHRAQVLTHLKLIHHRLGLLINFNVPLIKDGITRLVR